MSGAAAHAQKGAGTLLSCAAPSSSLSARSFFLRHPRRSEVHGGLWTITAVGFLLFAGTLTSELIAPLGLPHLTGYLVAGILAEPHVLRLVDEHTVKSLSPWNMLSLALIALAGGAELDFAAMRKGARGLSWATLVQCLLVLVVVGGSFLAAHPLIPFTHGLSKGALLGVALLWGALAVTRSPSATLGILAQTRARGPLTTFTLSFVMTSDVVVVVLVAMVLGVVKPLIDPSATFALDSFVTLGHELFGSVALGTTLGLFIAAYLRLINRQMLVVLLVLGFGASTVLDYLRFDSLLTFMVAGFIVLQHVESRDRSSSATSGRPEASSTSFSSRPRAPTSTVPPLAPAMASWLFSWQARAAHHLGRVAHLWGDREGPTRTAALGVVGTRLPGGPGVGTRRDRRPRLRGHRTALQGARHRDHRRERDDRARPLQDGARPVRGNVEGHGAEFSVDAAAAGFPAGEAGMVPFATNRAGGALHRRSPAPASPACLRGPSCARRTRGARRTAPRGCRPHPGSTSYATSPSRIDDSTISAPSSSKVRARFHATNELIQNRRPP